VEKTSSPRPQVRSAVSISTTAPTLSILFQVLVDITIVLTNIPTLFTTVAIF